MKTYKSNVTGNLLTYCEDGSLTIKLPNDEIKVFSKEEMQRFSNELKNVNRIHKPFALLFWTDCKNGNQSNWDLI